MCGIKRQPQASAKIRPICKQVSHLEVENSKKIINFYGRLFWIVNVKQ